MKCWRCAGEVEAKERIGFRDHCPKCDSALHVCRNCRFYDPAYHNQCRETQAERVVDKERQNFCEYFAPGAAAPAPVESGRRHKLDAFFKKS